MSETARSNDQMIDLLRDGERRQLIAVLSEIDGCVPLSVVVENVSDRIESPTTSEGSRALCERLRIRFHHNHLPRLAEAGVAEYNPDLHLVRPTAEIEAVSEFAEAGAKATLPPA